MVKMKRVRGTDNALSRRRKIQRAERTHELMVESVVEATWGLYSELESRMRKLDIVPEDKEKIKQHIRDRKEDVVAERKEASEWESDPLRNIVQNGTFKEKVLAFLALTSVIPHLSNEAHEKINSTTGIRRMFNIFKYNSLAIQAALNAVFTATLTAAYGLLVLPLAAIPTLMLASFFRKQYYNALHFRAEERGRSVMDDFTHEVIEQMFQAETHTERFLANERRIDVGRENPETELIDEAAMEEAAMEDSVRLMK
jgi:hypothetical protein